MSQGYYRYPTIAGDLLVFVCEDDLWSVNLPGGAARRLTTGFGAASFPRLSPDARTIAFISNDDGNPELYVMPAEGGVPKRLTFLGATLASISGWSPDGNEIFFSANPSAWYEREMRAFAISATGGSPRELGLGHVRALSRAADGRSVLGRNADDPARWKRYRGGTAGEIWIDTAGNGDFERLPLPDGNPVWPMWIDERIYVLTDHEGIGKIYSCAPDGSDLRAESNDSEYYARFPSTDGRHIVYGVGGSIALFDIAERTTRTIEIEAHSSAPQSVRRFDDASEMLEDYESSPAGTHVAFVARGQAFSMPLFEGPVVRYGEGSRSRIRLIRWMRDGKHLVGVTDRKGYEQIARWNAGENGEPKLLTVGDIGRPIELELSPNGETLAFSNHRHELCVLDLAENTIRTLDRSLGRPISGIAYSPDGRFIAYSWSPNSNSSILRIVKVKSGKIHDVTTALRVDRSPQWDPDGKYLYCIASRDFRPLYDALQFDLGFPQAERPFAITLRTEVPSPFVPQPKPLHRDHHDHHDDERDKKDEKHADIEIDFEGITGRMLAFQVDEGNYGDLVAVKGRALFTRYPVRGIAPQGGEDDEHCGGTLLSYDFEQQRCATLARDVDEMRLGPDGRTLLYTSGSRLRAIDALGDLPEDEEDGKPPAEPGRKSGFIDCDRASVEVLPQDEWAQMYREAWRLQTEQFWVADLSDVDWDRVYDRYKAVLPRVRTRGELSDLIWEMHGELGTSHAYEMGGDLRIPPQYRRGFLGADYRWDGERNAYRIERIYRGDSWDRKADSPLAEPGLEVREGDYLLSIAGTRLSAEIAPERLLVNTAGNEIALGIGNKRGDERTIVVKTLAGEASLRYRAWVERNRRYVAEKTGGAVGYLHIPDMGPWGFAEFHRGYLSEFDKRGLIVDIRYNRGGHVSPLLIEKLNRKRIGFDVSRYGPVEPYPPESVGGPIVGITNQFAGSDGDIFSHAFKLYGLGPLVGKRTWGGVIGINPYHHLVDGTVTTQPEYSFWFVDVGWKVENYGTDPDYDVDIAPQDYRNDRDPQLDRALELMERSLAAHVEIRPDLTARPSLRLPEC